MKAILLLEEGMEERDALNVVPVIVRYENVGFDGAMAGLLFPAIAEEADAGAAIEDEARAVTGDDFYAGGVAAVAPGTALGRRR